jgi:hypothetical protein
MAGKRSDQQENRPTSSRRSVLKVGGVALASLVGVGTVGTGSVIADDGPDTDFDPNKREEAVGFLNDIDDLSEQAQAEYAKELSHDQKVAIGDLYANAELEVSTYSEPTGVQANASYVSASKTTEATGTVPGFGTVYTHKQTLTWEYDGSDYQNASQQLSYDLSGPFATFKGKTEDDIDESSTLFTATLAAEYAADVLGVTRGGEAEIVTQGEADGDHNVVSKKAPTS